VAKENPEEPVTLAERRPWSSLFHERELLAQRGILDREIKP